MMFWINGGNAAACQLSPLVTSVITPVSKSTSTSSPCVDAVRRRLALQDRQADVDGVAVEDPGKGGGDDAGDAARLDGERRVLPGRAAAEVLVGHHDVARLHLVDEVRVDVLHAVGGQLLRGLRYSDNVRG